MKKGLKIGMLAVALLATTTAVISTGKVQAENSSNSKVEVVIGQYNSGQNECTGSDYIYNFTASTDVQTGSQSGSISCKFGKSAGQAVTLQLQSALTLSGDTSVTIPAENVLLTNDPSNWTSVPNEIAGQAPTTLSDDVFTTAKTLYNKKSNAIGDASSTNISIKVIVPAGQSDGTYNGVLVLTYGG